MRGSCCSQGELEHRSVKNTYKRTNFVNPIPQMTNLERREFHLRQRADELDELEKEFLGGGLSDADVTIEHGPEAEPEDPLHWGPSSERYNISQRGTPIRFGDFLSEHTGDPATKVSTITLSFKHYMYAGIAQGFFSRLQQHIVERLGTSADTGPTSRETISFPKGRFYQHNTIRVNYTTYDIRRARDTINPQSTQKYIMIRNSENNVRHPFWYAKLLAVLHVDAEIPNLTSDNQIYTPPQRFVILWVRWLGGIRWGGWSQNRLDLVGYVDDGSKSGSFGFVDPATIVRGSYLIPAFEFGRSKDLLDKSIAWDDAEEGDWAAYYVIRWGSPRLCLS